MSCEPVAEHLPDRLGAGGDVGLFAPIGLDCVEHLTRQAEVHRLRINGRPASFWFVGSIY